MQIKRCSFDDLEYALEAIRVVKKEEDNIQVGLVTEESMNCFLANPLNYLVIAIDQNEVTGFVVAYELQRVDRKSSAMLLYDINVLKNHRHEGIGTELINFLKNVCREKGMMKMWVPTERSNIPAVGVYSKTGGKISLAGDEVLFTWYPPFI